MRCHLASIDAYFHGETHEPSAETIFYHFWQPSLPSIYFAFTLRVWKLNNVQYLFIYLAVVSRVSNSFKVYVSIEMKISRKKGKHIVNWVLHLLCSIYVCFFPLKFSSHALFDYCLFGRTLRERVRDASIFLLVPKTVSVVNNLVGIFILMQNIFVFFSVDGGLLPP